MPSRTILRTQLNPNCKLHYLQCTPHQHPLTASRGKCHWINCKLLLGRCRRGCSSASRLPAGSDDCRDWLPLGCACRTSSMEACGVDVNACPAAAAQCYAYHAFNNLPRHAAKCDCMCHTCTAYASGLLLTGGRLVGIWISRGLEELRGGRRWAYDNSPPIKLPSRLRSPEDCAWGRLPPAAGLAGESTDCKCRRE